MANILEVKNLSKSYDGKKWALSNCSFKLQQGRICAIVGESGSGKTTLIRLIAGLERPNSGEVIIDGDIMSDDNKIIEPQHRQVGFVFQDYALFPHLTVKQNIQYGVRDNKNQRVEEMLKLVKMESYSKSYTSQLSGGQEQRVALARTLAVNNKFLLLDEPFSNLDTFLKSILRTEIHSIVKKLNISMIFITHDLYDALDIADDIIFLKDGELLQHNTIDELSEQDSHPEVQKMLQELKYNSKRILDILKSE